MFLDLKALGYQGSYDRVAAFGRQWKVGQIERVNSASKSTRLTLNEKKTVFTSKKFQRQLTGLVLANDGKVSMGRDKKREIRSMADHYRRGNLTSEETSRLRGLIAFALSVEPQYVESIQRMIGADAYSSLMHG